MNSEKRAAGNLVIIDLLPLIALHSVLSEAGNDGKLIFYEGVMISQVLSHKFSDFSVEKKLTFNFFNGNVELLTRSAALNFGIIPLFFTLNCFQSK
ncbi:hypothetical protein RM545_14635 [Zunongwangia sp. F260]|uniref:Uncharacterized protein n=1 Tax=Autumnicola lenta TaxID=3075593 RepID=A0ABU3CNK6_9FLAO|nr:hypothetical protein [Zunongwangia sp. F260]MDT0647933.1 hypothetical protein [Zunongwangia sp. F260]